ncbi:MAG TPA: YihY/virulence factor BrkB family protein [Bryobacteraceae bacterium]|nr:YihY/virulence factor BrkB family protein [Bryobacteraceae bacterium]
MIFDARPPAPRAWQRHFAPSARYWMRTEVHVYALAVSASVLLSFFPFLIVMISLCRYGFRWPAAVNAIYLALNDYFPGELGGFIRRNLVAVIESRGPMQITSIVLLLVTANGIFEPMEVALNGAWGAKENRSYFKNQLLSLGLIFLCGGLALLSFILTALNQEYLGRSLGFTARVPLWINLAFFKFAAVPVSILALFFIYWLLPNRQVRPMAVAPVAILVGLAIELLKYINLLIWPLLKEKLQREYGPFYISVTIVLFSFIASMIVLGGAEWAARHSPVEQTIRTIE